ADAAVQSVRKDEARYEGRVAVGLPVSVSKLLVSPLIRQFADRFPKASLSVVEGFSNDLYAQVLAGRLDFAILRNPVGSPQLSIEPIATEALYLVGIKPLGRNRRPVTVTDLVGLPFIMPSRRPVSEAAMARMGAPLNV